VEKKGQDVEPSVSPAELQSVMHNVFVRCDTCLRAEGSTAPT
jgi:hypothetical protein